MTGNRYIKINALLLLFFAAIAASIDFEPSSFVKATTNWGCLAQDNECGPTKGPCVTGECCSQFGWCGTDGDSFCGECCQSNCAGASAAQSPSANTQQVSVTSHNIVPDKARSALLQIYSQCNGRNWERKDNWASDVPLCSWEGIKCSANGDIIEITLRTNGLNGNFPTKEVFDGIPSITALSLEGNDDLMFSFEGVDKVTNLESLDVSKTRFNSFNGVNLYFTQLKEVYAAKCGLTGPFPTPLLDISRLERLDLSFNHMTGELPVDIGIFFRKMQVLFLHDNQLSGMIPDSMNNMEELKYIQLDSNKFSGRIPSFSSASQILGIDIRNQKAMGGGLSGPIPTNFLQSANGGIIQYINLSSNNISGELPVTLKRFPTSVMDFSDNEIEGVSAELCGTDCALLLCAPTTYSESGRQPSPIKNCSPCPSAIYWGATSCGTVLTPPTYFEINNPVIPHTNPVIPQSGDDLTTLKLLYGTCGGDEWKNNENWLGNEVCNFWGVSCSPTSSGMKSVTSILLASNNLKCTVPPQVFLLLNLQTLVLDGNDVEIDFTSIQHATSLQTLSLAFTGISSVEGIEKAPSLRKLDVANNKFNRIPTQIFQITTLHELYLGPNAFNLSPIPDSIGNLNELRLFECSSCQINGKIPAAISALTNLVSLNLEDNLMTGPLISGLEDLHELAFLNLSGNYFDGELPSFKESSKLRRVDLSDNAFVGVIPENFMERVNPDFFEYLDLSENDLVGFLPSILSRLPTFDVSDNSISGLDSELCDGACGCDCILCGVGFYNTAGRQDSDANPCEPCSSAEYFGQTSCSDEIHSWDDGKQMTNAISQPEGYQKPTSIEEEMEALIKFYEKCAGTYWFNSEFWMEENYGHCEWYGIKCHPETGSVVSISLGSNNVQCVVQELFDSLPNLSSLSLNSNPLKGFDFAMLETAKSLKEVNLDATGISSIEGIHHSPSLEAISLRFNDLRQITELSMVPTLKSIRASHNHLTSLPSFDNIPNLQTLIADNNNISGSLDGISFPYNLIFLDLSRNQISAVSSTSFSAVSSSASLDVDLSENKIESIPVELCNKGKWNGGDLGKFGCDGLLCKKGYYSKYGRQTSDTECSLCRSESSFFGATTCADPALEGSNPMRGGTVSFLVIMSFVQLAMLMLIIAGIRKRMRERREEERVFITSETRNDERPRPFDDDNEII